MDLDVLHVGQLEQGLEAPIPEDRILQGGGVGVLAIHGPEFTEVGEVLRVAAHEAEDDRPGKQAPVSARHGAAGAFCVRLGLPLHLVGGPSSQVNREG